MDRQEINTLLNYLENNLDYVNPLQHNFIKLSKENYRLTGVLGRRQIECLNEIKENLPSLVAEDTGNDSGSDKYYAQYSSIDYLTPSHLRFC